MSESPLLAAALGTLYEVLGRALDTNKIDPGIADEMIEALAIMKRSHATMVDRWQATMDRVRELERELARKRGESNGA